MAYLDISSDYPPLPIEDRITVQFEIGPLPGWTRNQSAEERDQDINSSILHTLKIPFQNLPLYINDSRPAVRVIAKARLAGELYSHRFVRFVDADIHGAYALFTEIK